MTETSPEEYRERRKRLAQVFKSGEFQQAQHRLRDGDDCYCPLGLTCEAYRRETGIGEWIPRYTDEETPVLVYYGFECPGAEPGTTLIATGELPRPVQDYYGFYSHTGLYKSDTGFWKSFISDNDDRHLPLGHFAKLVEDPPALLFKPETL